MELTLEELEALEPGSYTLLDLRSEQGAVIRIGHVVMLSTSCA